MKTLVFLFILANLYYTQALTASELNANDIVALNYALTLENLESTFYTKYLSQFSQADFAAAGYNSTVYSYFILIKNHEVAHCNTLRTTISNLGGTPVEACNYTFPVTNVTTFIQVSDLLENTGVSAYDGAINTINDLSLRIVAASIAGVEARHSAYLNQLVGFSPFPLAIDNATSPSVIRQQISPFIVACPYEITLPVPANVSCSTNVVSENIPTTQSSTSQKRATSLTEAQLAQNDIVALNYALTLEHLEATFYTMFLDEYSAANFTDAGYDAQVYNYVVLIKNHEIAHVNALTETITALGGSPVPVCNYTFSVTSVSEFLATARLLENTGISAYDGAIYTINDLNLRITAASIASVEAKHASYLNEILGQVPFPSTFENATAPSTIINQISPFIESCPYTIQAPVSALSECYVNGGTPSTGSTTGSTSGTTGTNDVGRCANLVVLCQSTCAGQVVAACSCTDGFPNIQCGAGSTLVFSILMTITFVIMYIMM